LSEENKPTSQDPVVDSTISKSEVDNNIEEKRWLINEIQYLLQSISERLQTDKQRYVDLAEGYRKFNEQGQRVSIAAAAFIATLLVALPNSGLLDLSTMQKSWMAGLFVLDLAFGLAIYFLFTRLTHGGYRPLAMISPKYDQLIQATDRMKDYIAWVWFCLNSCPIDTLFSLCIYSRLLGHWRAEITVPIIEASSSPFMRSYRKLLFYLICSEMNIFSEGHQIYKENQTEFSEKFKNDMKEMMGFELLEYYQQKEKMFAAIRAAGKKSWGFDIVEKCETLRSQNTGNDSGDIYSQKYDSTYVGQEYDSG
jgi:hypothetical protein